jgi:methylase of polypeptide subunit release factors
MVIATVSRWKFLISGYQLAHWLQPQGWLLLEHGWQQGEAVRTLLTRNGFQADPVVSQ